MFKLFFIVAIRNLARDRLTSAIQLIGLMIGIGCYFLIQHYVAYQYSYNRQFSQADSIYRINLIRDENKPQALTPLRLASELVSNFNDIADTTRVSATTISVKYQQSVYGERAIFVDHNYFEFFDFALLEGDAHTALHAPNSVVLHQDLAVKYFGRITNVIGQVMTINGNEHIITGVIKQSKTPHTMPKTLLLPIKSYFDLLPNKQWTEMWNFNATITFAKVRNKQRIGELDNSVSAFYDQRAQGLSSYKSYRVVFEPLLDVYLNNVTTRSLTPPGSKLMVTVFQIIALLIMFLACVNFTNLSTASAMRRGKDVGVRKAIGASKYQLITQYLLEALLLTYVATGLAVILVQLCLPWFNQLMTVQLSLDFGLANLLELMLLATLVGCIAGSYPAFFLSTQSPALVLKGVINTSKQNVVFRQLLIVIQFAIASFLLVVSLIVNWQMNYIENMPQGYERENIMVLNNGDELYNAFKTQALQHPYVEAVTMSHTVPTKATRTSHTFRKQGDINSEIWAGNNPVSHDYFTVFGIKLLAGRDFSKAFTNDAYVENKNNITNSQGTIIINQTLAQLLDWTPEQAIGKTVTLGNINDGLHDHQIIGVVEDTHYTNAKNSVPPMSYVLSGEPKDLSLRWLSIRFNRKIDENSIKALERIWLSLNNKVAFKYDWLEDLFAANYRNENLQTQLLNIFTILAFVVTTIGLFGLAAFSTNRRVKEIAIRKILGAGNGQLCFMLVNQFTLLILLANAFALPLTYWQVREWLNDFIYRIDLPYTAFGVGILMSLIIAYATIVFIAYKAVNAKPVDALASE